MHAITLHDAVPLQLGACAAVTASVDACTFERFATISARADSSADVNDTSSASRCAIEPCRFARATRTSAALLPPSHNSHDSVRPADHVGCGAQSVVPGFHCVDAGA